MVILDQCNVSCHRIPVYYDQDDEEEKKSRLQERRVPLRNKKEEEVGDNENGSVS